MKKLLFSCFAFLVSLNLYAKDLGTVGALYEIKERDMLEEIEARAKGVDWVSVFNKAKERIKENLGKIERVLPKASQNRTYYIDLTTKLDRPIYIRDEKGNPKVLYPKGYSFNPLDYTTITQTYVFFDTSRPEEVAWYKKTYADNLSAMPIITRGSALKFAEGIHREVYLIDEELMKTFKLTATPTVVYQEKKKLRADEIYLKPISEVSK